MRLGKYTLECREFGQAEGAHKLCASERHSQKRVKCKAIFPSASAQMGSPKILGFMGRAIHIDPKILSPKQR